jgi:hypothetical protein
MNDMNRRGSEILFEEVQSFTNRTVQQLLFVITGVLFVTTLLFLARKMPGKEDAIVALAVCTAIAALISWFLQKARLITQIRVDGIYMRYPPLVGKFKVYKWPAITRLYTRKYKPLIEYGGWGIRYGMKGWAYNVGGRTGLQLVLNSDTRVLIGTNCAIELTAILQKMGKLTYDETI